MIKKTNDFLSGWIMTLIGSIFLIISFILPRLGYAKGIYFALVTLFICGLPLIYLSIHRLIYNKGINKISSALLISMAMIAAILIGDLFAAGEVAFIMEFGALLEDMTTRKARKGLNNLISLLPKMGRVIRNNQVIEIPYEEIITSDIVRVLPGERIPIDGVIIKGETSVDQSVITGESLPIDKEIGDSVFSGTINQFGAIDLRATNVGNDSSIKKLILLVENAEKNQAPTQRIADKWASYLVPIALLIALLTYLFTMNITRAVTILVVFCPCALVLATPTAIMAAIGQATKQGVLIKSGAALETMSKVTTIAFDKTGTLTFGNLEVSHIIPLDKLYDKNKLLSLTASIEAFSTHPIAKAILNYAKSTSAKLMEIDSFNMISGKGVSANLGGVKYLVGNEQFLKEQGIFIEDEHIIDMLNKLKSQGNAIVLIADFEKILGIIALSDTIRPDSKSTISKLHKLGTKTILLTGDNQMTAEHISKNISISSVFSDLLPEEKVNEIEKIKTHSVVCMVGDGVNDAPALKTAHVGISMGAMGSDIAIEASDIALMNEDISKIAYLKWLSVATVKTIKSAITLSMVINFLAILLSVMGILNPTTGALVHNGGSCLVVLLAALLYDKKYVE